MKMGRNRKLVVEEALARDSTIYQYIYMSSVLYIHLNLLAERLVYNCCVLKIKCTLYNIILRDYGYPSIINFNYFLLAITITVLYLYGVNVIRVLSKVYL